MSPVSLENWKALSGTDTFTKGLPNPWWRFKSSSESPEGLLKQACWALTPEFLIHQSLGPAEWSLSLAWRLPGFLDQPQGTRTLSSVPRKCLLWDILQALQCMLQRASTWLILTPGSKVVNVKRLALIWEDDSAFMYAPRDAAYISSLCWSLPLPLSSVPISPQLAMLASLSRTLLVFPTLGLGPVTPPKWTALPPALCIWGSLQPLHLLSDAFPDWIKQLPPKSELYGISFMYFQYTEIYGSFLSLFTSSTSLYLKGNSMKAGIHSVSLLTRHPYSSPMTVTQ